MFPLHFGPNCIGKINSGQVLLGLERAKMSKSVTPRRLSVHYILMNTALQVFRINSPVLTLPSITGITAIHVNLTWPLAGVLLWLDCIVLRFRRQHTEMTRGGAGRSCFAIHVVTELIYKRTFKNKHKRNTFAAYRLLNFLNIVMKPVSSVLNGCDIIITSVKERTCLLSVWLSVIAITLCWSNLY